MNRLLMITFLSAVCVAPAFAQKNEGAVRVSPNGVNVNANGATTVFLTFGGLSNYRPAEATWCGELTSASPDIGFKCDPTTIYGSLPDRYDLSTSSGRQALTDIMSIPPSVARRAYQDAVDGAKSSFFYVRHFVNLKGGPDEYVFVTCRMAGGGAGVPLALTSVKLAFGDDLPLVVVKPGEKLPPIRAEIAYNGTGRLVGRWEVVAPGDELPSEQDLLTEATLPVEERGRQRRYTQLSRFNVFLPPTGKHTLTGPNTSRLPTAVEGQYLVLLRVEASDDPDSGSNLAAVKAGSGFIQSGAVAGFPLPVLRYFVGSKVSGATTTAAFALTLSLPTDEATVTSDQAIEFSWNEFPEAAAYRLEIEDRKARPLLSAMLKRGAPLYRAPSWLKEKAGDGMVRWRVVAFDHAGSVIGESLWRGLKLVSKTNGK